MKSSVGVLAGVLAGVTGLVFFLVAIWQPGRLALNSGEGVAGKPLLAEAKKKAETTQEAWKTLVKKKENFSGLEGSEGEHRVFVSPILVFLEKNSEPVQPLDRKMKTADGLEIGWKMKHGFDPASPQVRDEDPDGDGFTNGEEYASMPPTDPLRQEDSPPKENKLRSRAGAPVPLKLTFPEKKSNPNGDELTIRFLVAGNSLAPEYTGKPGDTFWILAGPGRCVILKEEAEMIRTREQEGGGGKNVHLIPIRIGSYQKKSSVEVNAGVPEEVDRSEVVLERKDAVGDASKLVFRGDALIWDVGEIRIVNTIPGGGEMGPYQIGQSFVFEGKEFAILGREGNRIRLLNRSEPGEKTLLLSPEEGAGGLSPNP